MQGKSLGVIAVVILPWNLSAHEDTAQTIATENPLETTHVEGRRTNLVGKAISASEGVVGQDDLALRPLLRSGEILEAVPGMVVTQHSGTGKANQYFLRGFNLDHGTDFATSIDGMPVNMRSHGHGQGYTDLNFIIPETVSSIAYRKGAYYAETGDFSGAGSADLSTFPADASQLENGELSVTAGENAYLRTLAMDSVHHGAAHWLYALELNTYDGPWTDISEDLQKMNFLLKRSSKFASGDLSLSAMFYDNSWNSADQIPVRAVSEGMMDELGSLDTTVGGESSRISLSAQWSKSDLEISAYALRYDMNLWSNFTYFLDDEDSGDQFEQVDERWIYGGELRYTKEGSVGSKPASNIFGATLRYDAIDEVGLYKSAARERLGVVRNDAVNESSIGLYWENQIAWSTQWRSVIGLRYDNYNFDVSPLTDVNINDVDLSENGGSTDDALLSAKASLILSLHEDWETYISAGQGFHSNDARGTTITVDPADGAAVDTVDPLVRSLGYEWGLRGFINDKLNASLALWSLELDSELLFVGDAGNTEASRASERMGVEVSSYYRLNENWTLDLEYAWTDAEFSETAPEGNFIPGAIEHVLQTGVSAKLVNGWFGSARLRYFGERPLIEDNSVRSDSSTVVNLLAGYEFDRWTIKAELLNALDSNDHDIDYFYESRLQTEVSGAGVEDIHYHVLEPRTLRLQLAYHF